MTVQQQVDTLAASIDDLKDAVVAKTTTLDVSVADAQSANAQAQTAKTNTLSARDQAGAFKDATYTAAQSAASAVAYQDLTAIAAEKAVTAVDVFIYDTSKDSDGGAWRHRCAGTSWFNEPLNTAIRGARREFPAVAVIVAEAAKLTIYDGDDPALPMWMVFNGDASGPFGILRADTPITSLSALNSIIAIGSGSQVQRVGFVSDTAAPVVFSGTFLYNGGISERNDSLGATQISSVGIVNAAVNDVAMTVLPEAPIDQATGLPVPTIAVATAGGVSIIKGDGSVVDVVNYVTAPPTVSFANVGGLPRIVATSRYSNWVFVIDIPSGDINSGAFFDSLEIGGAAAFFSEFTDDDGVIHAATNRGLKLYAKDQGFVGANKTTASMPMSAIIRAGSTSGWMMRSTAGSFLSDTADADLVGDGTLTAPDRSVANKPLLVNGTITRAPVATGAELVAYSGFSETNYLEGTDASYADTLYALGWEQTNGVWEFKHGVVNAAPIDGLTITGMTLKIAGTKPKALVRVTATTPTAAQLAKIEADERFLFQDNAACTLYGASDAVTALAHDPDTGLLHVGTSAGRSVFQGLRRVANTTVPVGAAIAAGAGMVVDE
jgi:hypothetical protein